MFSGVVHFSLPFLAHYCITSDKHCDLAGAFTGRKNFGDTNRHIFHLTEKPGAPYS